MTSLKTLFIITVSTMRLVFPNMPAAMGLPETAKPPAVRSFGIEVASDIVAPKDAKASVTVPAGLRVGSTVDMQLDASAAKPEAQDQTSKFKLVEYWGIGSEVRADQPKVTQAGGAPAEAAKIPDKSYAYWPRMDTKPLANDAATPGAYALKTSYCGGTSVTLAPEQGFLDPIEITSPTREADLAQPITIRWKPVANAVGYVLNVYGGGDAQTITWTSSAKPELSKGIEYRPLGKDELDKLIKEGGLIPPYVASCAIPAGIFKGSSSVMLVMTAVGKDTVQTKDKIETQVIVRSTASMPLYNTP